ncbi:hypothetical protein GE21DRAFT_1081690 [Neurospora crassa]|nr:hypothetical protein GE21DRAFT_1081690 [Neurospora crassa]
MASWSLLHIIYHQSANSYTTMLSFIFCYYFTSLLLFDCHAAPWLASLYAGVWGFFFPEGDTNKPKHLPIFYQE